MIIGGPLAFLAGLFSLGTAGVGEVAKDAKIKAGTPSLNEYGYYKQRNIANFNEGYLKDQVTGPFRNIYLGGLDWDKVAKDFAHKHGFKYSPNWMYDWPSSQRLKELYYDRILDLVGIQTNSLYKSVEHKEYFTDPKWRIENYEYLNRIPYNNLPQYTDEQSELTWGEIKRQQQAWFGIRAIDDDLRGLRERYAGQYSPLKIPHVDRIQFLEEIISAQVVKIQDIKIIENAEHIEIAIVNDHNIVVQRNTFQIGDIAVVIYANSKITNFKKFEFLKQCNYKVRKKKIKGVVSEGILVHLDILPRRKKPYDIGENVSYELGVVPIIKE